MPREILIRKATIKDLAVIVSHRRRLFEEMGYTNSAKLGAMARHARKLLARWISKGAYLGWMAVTREGKIIGGGGVGIAEWPPHPRNAQARRATVFNVFVEPEFRLQGLARRLMKVMIGWCRKEGFAIVSLHASRAGRPLYESMGFKPTSEMQLRLRPRK